jgi:2-iminoacetate synthase ThiH
MTRRAIILAGLGLCLLLVSLFALSQCQRARNAGTEARINKGQAGAAIDSGVDAVGTVSNGHAAAAAEQQSAKETSDEIRNAIDARGVTAAGRNGLCRLAAYRDHPDCVQQPRPR